MTRVIHTGDTHLGYRQYHSPERREDFLAAFRRVAEDAVEMDVDAVVHAGDLFHDRRPGLSDLLGAIDVLETLTDADVPFLAVVGNHEAKRDAQWLDLFEAMGLATRLDASPVVVGDTAFYGLDYVPRTQRADLAYEFDDHDAAHAALVSHGLFDPLVPDYGTVEWDAAEVLERASVDFDAMLLGDEHAATRQEVAGTWVTYCGSTERVSAGEREARGYNVVEFDGDVALSRRGIETREFVFVDLELAGSEGFERLRERLREHDLAEAVVHVTLTGGGEDVSAARVEEFAADRGALVARVTDHREFEHEADLEVAFADPDEAVRERVRELGLSRAARDLDETIRASDVADSNVADEVERRVRGLVEEPDAFETVPEDGESAADDGGDASVDDTDRSEGPAEPVAATDGSSDRAAAANDRVDDAVEATAQSDETTTSDGGVESEDRDGTNDGGQSNDEAGSVDGVKSTDGAEPDDGPDQSDDAPRPEEADGQPRPAEASAGGTGDGDGQASMEDFQ